MTVQFERLLPHQVRERRDSCPLAYLPAGTLEWHGVHNPVGLDTLKAHKLCCLAAERGGGVVFPPLWYGEHREIELLESVHDQDGRIAAAYGVPAESFRKAMKGKPVRDQRQLYLDLVDQTLREIASFGFKAIFALAGHYPLPRHLEYAGRDFARDTGVAFFTAAEHSLVMHPEFQKPFGKRPGDHAGFWETSLLMALDGDTIDLTRLDPRERAPLGIMGSAAHPAESNAEFGRNAVSLIVDQMVKIGRRMLKDAGDAAQSSVAIPLPGEKE
jgi:creatinine amidohydrolase